MAVEVEDLYSNLNKLLSDICKFLTDETNYEKLSPYARKHADELISRSKQQLQEIAKVAVDTNENDGAYVDMERKSDKSSDEDQNNIYSSVEEAAVIPPQAIVQNPSNPYVNLPAKDLSQELKYGPLSMKCKIILKFEKIRRIYAGLHDNWLIVYSSEKDIKPLQTFNLKFHKAQVVISKQSKNPPQDFELTCTLGERKTCYFLALTHKDMLQWTSHINRCYDNLNKPGDLSVPEDNISESYDMIPHQENAEEDEEEIYHDIETYVPDPEMKKKVIEPPDLPARRNIPLPPVPQTEKFDTSNESLSSTYDAVQSRISIASKSSFSEDEEDDIYEPFVSKAIESKPQPKLQNNQIRVNSFSEKPKTPAKPKIFQEKPKHFVMLKK